ncbi:MAG: hypothetical protein MPW15_15385 [Candidatus Manganitrophus sp.]|nr:hypothetical protein [Candidatus Manganitrophus sp.]
MLLMQDPELIMLDEPVAGMSVRERQQTGELLARICQGNAPCSSSSTTWTSCAASPTRSP